MATESQLSGVPPVVGTDPAAMLLKALLKRDPTPEEIAIYGPIYKQDPALGTTLMQEYALEKKTEADRQAALDPFSVTHLVLFTNDPTAEAATGANTVWLFDAKDQEIEGQYYAGTLIPFATEEGFNKFFAGTGMTLKDYEAANMINRIPPSALNDSESKFYHSRLVKGINGINAAGTMAPVEAARWRYGKDIDEAMEMKAAQLISNVFNIVKRDDETFTDAYYNNAFNDQVNKAKYIYALAYGGYDVNDIYRDIVAHNKRVEGDKDFANYTGISQTQSKSQWVSVNPSYKTITQGQTAIALPEIPGLSASWKELGGPLWAMPPQAFSLGVSPYKVDFDDPNTIAEIEKMQPMMEEIAIQMANSDNQRDLDAAKYNWEQLKKEAEETLGIKLEDNAWAAWNQLEELKTSTSERGVLNTGIYNRAHDMIMRQRRLADARFRESNNSVEDDKLRTHLLNNAGDEEIAKFISENPDKAKEWGLLPDDATKAFFNMENLKRLYPDEKEETLQDIINVTLGGTAEGGTPFFHSTIMRNHFANLRNLKKDLWDAKVGLYGDKLTNEMEAAKEDFDEGSKYGGQSELPEGEAGSGTAGSEASGAGMTNKMPAGVLVRNSADGKVYFVDKEKKLRYVSDPSWIKGAHVQNVDSSHFAGTTMGAAITTRPMATDGKPMLFKGGAEAQKMFDNVGIDWTKPRGYQPTAGATVAAKPATAIGTTTVTLPKTSSSSSMAESQKTPNLTPAPSDSRYWSINPDNLYNKVTDAVKTSKTSTAPTLLPTPTPANVDPSDSRYWSINPNNLLKK